MIIVLNKLHLATGIDEMVLNTDDWYITNKGYEYHIENKYMCEVYYNLTRLGYEYIKGFLVHGNSEKKPKQDNTGKKFMCPNKYCVCYTSEGSCIHTVPHQELEDCLDNTISCPNCVEVKNG